MLKCDQVKPLLSEYIDRELTLWKMQMVRLHLKSCPDCSRELALLRDTDKLLKLRKNEVVVTSNHFTEVLLAKVSIIARNEQNNVPFSQRLIGKIKTYAVWFKYSFDLKNHLSFVWKASFTLLFLITLIGLFSLSSFHRPDYEKKYEIVKKTKTVNFIKVEFVKPDTQNYRSKKNLPSFDS